MPSGLHETNSDNKMGTHPLPPNGMDCGDELQKTPIQTFLMQDLSP